MLLLAGDEAGYRKVCTEMLEHSGQCGLCGPTMSPAPAPWLPTRSRTPPCPERRRKTNSSNNAEFWSLTEQGALAYRAGRYDDAAALFQRSLQADARPARAVLNWLWLSLVEQRRGKPAEARAWLGKATKWLEQYPEGISVVPTTPRGSTCTTGWRRRSCTARPNGAENRKSPRRRGRSSDGAVRPRGRRGRIAFLVPWAHPIRGGFRTERVFSADVRYLFVMGVKRCETVQNRGK